MMSCSEDNRQLSIEKEEQEMVDEASYLIHAEAESCKLLPEGERC
jgi:hypothetical protein